MVNKRGKCASVLNYSKAQSMMTNLEVDSMKLSSIENGSEMGYSETA